MLFRVVQTILLVFSNHNMEIQQLEEIFKKTESRWQNQQQIAIRMYWNPNSNISDNESSSNESPNRSVENSLIEAFKHWKSI